MRARTSPHGTQFGPYTVLDLHELPEDGKGYRRVGKLLYIAEF
jgi:hypothetical protein